MTDRRPEIDAYLREHRDRYTSQALRSALLDAGYDPAEVDAALSAWPPNGPAATELRGRFWRYTWLAHGLALLIVVALVAVAGNSTMRGVWPIVAAILAVVLLVGVALSGLIVATNSGAPLALVPEGFAPAPVLALAGYLGVMAALYAWAGRKRA